MHLGLRRQPAIHIRPTRTKAAQAWQTITPSQLPWTWSVPQPLTFVLDRRASTSSRTPMRLPLSSPFRSPHLPSMLAVTHGCNSFSVHRSEQRISSLSGSGERQSQTSTFAEGSSGTGNRWLPPRLMRTRASSAYRCRQGVRILAMSIKAWRRVEKG